MGFKRMVPSSAGELKGYLDQVHKNASHVNSVKVNESNAHLEIDLDFSANMAGYSDMYMPIKKGKLAGAKELVDRMMRQSAAGFAPTESDASNLFDMIDQHAG